MTLSIAHVEEVRQTSLIIWEALKEVLHGLFHAYYLDMATPYVKGIIAFSLAFTQLFGQHLFKCGYIRTGHILVVDNKEGSPCQSRDFPCELEVLIDMNV